MTRCPTCDTTWHGLTECHCATCHAHFGSIDAFDRHRKGPADTRHCVDPATVLRKDGDPVFRAVDRNGRPTWVVDKPARVFPVAERESEPLEGDPGSPGNPGGSQAVSEPRRDVMEQALADVDQMFRRAFGHGP